MVEEVSVIQSVTVYKGDQEQTYTVGEDVNGSVVIEIVDKSTANIPKFEFLDEDGQTIFGIENLPCQVEWVTIAVDGPAGITPEMLLEAYVNTGLKPKQHTFYDHVGNDVCACGIGALNALNGGEHNWESASNYGDSKFGAKYTGGFMSGFDGVLLREKVTYSPDFLRGYSDGRAAWEAVKHLSEGAEANEKTV